jgi:hypothetical protein
MLRVLFIVGFMLSGVLTACVVGPIKLTCHEIGYPVATGQEVILSDFSVTAPKGGTWCQVTRVKGTAIFVTSSVVGPAPFEPVEGVSLNTVLHHAFALQASVVHLDQRSIVNQQDFTEFARAFLGREYLLRFLENGVQVGAPGRDPSFTVRRVELLPDPTLADVCVRFEVDGREQGDPDEPGDFEVHNYGALCRLPAHPDRLAYMFLSERHLLGKPAYNPSTFSTLKAGDAEAFFNSFRPL